MPRSRGSRGAPGLLHTGATKASPSKRHGDFVDTLAIAWQNVAKANGSTEIPRKFRRPDWYMDYMG